MKRWVAVIISFIWLSSCSFDRQSRVIRRETQKYDAGGVRFIAQHVGRPGRYILFRVNNHFIYNEVGPRPHKIFGRMRYYAGQYEERHDTLFLSYYNNIEPAGMADFFIKDTSLLQLVYPRKEGGEPEILITKKLRPDNRGLIRGM
jgi:hypothetical protein